MAQCRKMIGKRRCKAHCMKGQKYCMFHSKKQLSFRGSRKGRSKRTLAKRKVRY